jgi:thiol:disulfide interchange protein DsbA
VSLANPQLYERIGMKRRDFSTQLAMAALALPFVGSARAQGAPVEGQQYVKLSEPVPVDAPAGKVDVVEFFSYACPHCNAFEPTLEAWARQLPPYVNFHRIPVPFLFNYQNFQRIYYALEAMGQVEAMQLKVFHAVHVEHQRLDSPEAIGAFMAKNGVDQAKFMALFNSFTIQSKVRQAKQLADAYKIDGVPTLGIHGRFNTSPSLAAGEEQALHVADYLIQRVHAGK